MFHRAKHLVQKSFFNKQMGKKNAFPPGTRTAARDAGAAVGESEERAAPAALVPGGAGASLLGSSCY